MAVAEFESATNLNTVETMTPEMVLQQQKEQNSTLIQLEMQRIEKMQRRQQKELEQMIQVRMIYVEYRMVVNVHSSHERPTIHFNYYLV